MSTEDGEDLVAPCGIDCGICELNMCKDKPLLLNFLAAKGVPKEKLPCDGCRSVKGACPVIGEVCETYACAITKNVGFCFECEEFPCSRLHPAANRADVLPHNMKLFNLCTIKRDGVKGFIDKSKEIKHMYYKGKMEIGKGPKLKE